MPVRPNSQAVTSTRMSIALAIVSVPAVIALLVYVMRHAHNGLEEVIVYGTTWLPLISGVASP